MYECYMQIEERHVADEKTVIVKEGSNILCLMIIYHNFIFSLFSLLFLIHLKCFFINKFQIST